MKRKSPISIDNIQFYTLEYFDEDTVVTFSIEQFPYDNRGDFAVDSCFQGLAAKIRLSNARDDGRGVRREVELTLVDTTMRCVVTSRRERVNIRRDEIIKSLHVYFPKESGLERGRSYRLVVSDPASDQILAERVVNILDCDRMGNPEEWYKVCDGGVRPAWESNLYKSLNTVDDHDYYVRFNLCHNFGHMPPAVLPEVEIRLHYPDGHYVTSCFREPRYFNADAYENNILSVESPFATTREINGVFYAELLCMDYPIAGYVFDTAAKREVCGDWFGFQIDPLDDYSLDAATERLREFMPYCFDDDDEDFSEDAQDVDEAADEAADIAQPFESVVPTLEELTGISRVKEKLRVYERLVRFNGMRSERGLPILDLPLHAMFLGSPGTGKTTVAKLMGQMLHRAGVLSKGHVVVRERANLIGKFYHSEAEKVLAAMEEARGGILLIDEAYQLYQPDDPRDPGKFVIETLLTALSDDTNRDWMLVLAGYPDEMMRMFDMNPGFKSRIPDSNIYTFDDFSEAELMEIAENYLARNSYALTPDAQGAVRIRLKADYEQRGRNFGNARHVLNMIKT
ncbi:MAG: AAA family ATPase, partial [Muribaculaceae bacterium]|nr:AAA family ATPase [Muribaculaceae bacterium]